MPSHIALLGDSIFDNGAYTGGEPDVVTHLRDMLPCGWRATLCAVDGSTARDFPAQVERVPPDASRLIVSVGGNDAILNADLLEVPVRSTAETLALFSERVQAFEKSYRRAVDAVLALERPATLCSIYNGDLDPEQKEIARIALKPFNDVRRRWFILMASTEDLPESRARRTVFKDVADRPRRERRLSGKPFRHQIQMPIPNADHAIVDANKVRDYLLNLEHPDGGSKAVWFHSLGYTRDQWQLLAEDLLAIARECGQYASETTRFGIKYKAAGSVGRPNHRPGAVLTVWIVEDADPPRLVTAYPDEGQ